MVLLFLDLVLSGTGGALVRIWLYLQQHMRKILINDQICSGHNTQGTKYV